MTKGCWVCLSKNTISITLSNQNNILRVLNTLRANGIHVLHVKIIFRSLTLVSFYDIPSKFRKGFENDSTILKEQTF